MRSQGNPLIINNHTEVPLFKEKEDGLLQN